jgi:hypothetical protein
VFAPLAEALSHSADVQRASGLDGRGCCFVLEMAFTARELRAASRDVI